MDKQKPILTLLEQYLRYSIIIFVHKEVLTKVKKSLLLNHEFSATEEKSQKLFSNS